MDLNESIDKLDKRMEALEKELKAVRSALSILAKTDRSLHSELSDHLQKLNGLLGSVTGVTALYNDFLKQELESVAKVRGERIAQRGMIDTLAENKVFIAFAAILAERIVSWLMVKP